MTCFVIKPETTLNSHCIDQTLELYVISISKPSVYFLYSLFITYNAYKIDLKHSQIETKCFNVTNKESYFYT